MPCHECIQLYLPLKIDWANFRSSSFSSARSWTQLNSDVYPRIKNSSKIDNMQGKPYNIRHNSLCHARHHVSKPARKNSRAASHNQIGRESAYLRNNCIQHVLLFIGIPILQASSSAVIAWQEELLIKKPHSGALMQDCIFAVVTTPESLPPTVVRIGEAALRVTGRQP